MAKTNDPLYLSDVIRLGNISGCDLTGNRWKVAKKSSFWKASFLPMFFNHDRKGTVSNCENNCQCVLETVAHWPMQQISIKRWLSGHCSVSSGMAQLATT
jgi:hypothetical protein